MSSSKAIFARLCLVVAIAFGLGGVLTLNATGNAESAPVGRVVAKPAKTAVPTATEASYTLPLSDGYGISSCMATGEACGADVANAVCESHGYLTATSFGTDAAGQAVTIDCRA